MSGGSIDGSAKLGRGLALGVGVRLRQTPAAASQEPVKNTLHNEAPGSVSDTVVSHSRSLCESLAAFDVLSQEETERGNRQRAHGETAF